MARGEEMVNIILGLGLTQRQREKKVCCNNKLWEQQKCNSMIATKEDWEDDRSGRVA
jgi:hypothetical protein